jgi:hypothetical protein
MSSAKANPLRKNKRLPSRDLRRRNGRDSYNSREFRLKNDRAGSNTPQKVVPLFGVRECGIRTTLSELGSGMVSERVQGESPEGSCWPTLRSDRSICCVHSVILICFILLPQRQTLDRLYAETEGRVPSPGIQTALRTVCCRAGTSRGEAVGNWLGPRLAVPDPRSEPGTCGSATSLG